MRVVCRVKAVDDTRASLLAVLLARTPPVDPDGWMPTSTMPDFPGPIECKADYMKGRYPIYEGTLEAKSYRHFSHWRRV